MGLFFGSVLLDLTTLGVCLFGLIYYYFNSNFGYWKKKGVHYLKPDPFFGNMKDFTLLRISHSELFENIYQQLEGHKFAGIFQSRTPALVLRDPELIKTFITRDFNHFQHRGQNVDEKNDPLGAHLFSLGGRKWRILRTKLTPTFTSGKMRMMFHLMEECARQLKEHLAEPAARGEETEIKEILAKFTTDIIGTCAFGLNFNSMADSDSEFRNMGKKVFAPSLSSVVKRLALAFIPAIAKVFHISLITKEVQDFFLSAVKETVDYRQKNNVVRNDFLQLLLQLKNKGRVDDDVEGEGPQGRKTHNGDVRNGAAASNDVSREDAGFELTDNLLAAQCFVFFLAGFETSSTTMSFCLYELALQPDLQTRVREEILSVLRRTDGRITYDAIQEMELLDRVVAETLRMYPPAPMLVRHCTIPYTIPGTTVHLEKGTRVLVPVYALHRDPKHYPDPERFDPERFSEENRTTRHHYAYLPFGEGPRICIGMRFGLLQAKVGLATLLRDYEFAACSKTQIPVKLNPKAIVLAQTAGNWLRISERP